MHCVSRLFASCVLISLHAKALPAADEGVRLLVDRATQSLHVTSLLRAHVFLVLGGLAAEPIQIGGIAIDVLPQHVLYLGEHGAGETTQLAVPRGLYQLSAEAIAFDEEHFALLDSNVVRLADAYLDLVDATFAAHLIATDGIAGSYAVDASLTAPEGGYEFLVDGVELSEVTMNVYLRLIEPGRNEINIPVLTEHRQIAKLGDDAGKVVHVYLLRQRRGEVGAEVYRLMAELPVAGR